MDHITITNNSGASRYELQQGGCVAARAEYKAQDGALVFTHTEVDPQFEGKGLGADRCRSTAGGSGPGWQPERQAAPETVPIDLG